MVRWFDFTPRPRLFLALVACILYLPGFFLPFMVDDYRSLSQLRDYHERRIDRIDLYDFVRNSGQVAAERRMGRYPWWIADDLRFRFFRPISERSLYLDYLLFGASSFGYRATSLLLYIVGVWIVLALYRELADERRARWAALIFTLAGAHAIPVIFPSARCDLTALVSGLLGTLLIARFLRFGGAARLILAIGAYLVALGSKEVSLGLVLAPPLLLWALSGQHRGDARFRHRGAAATLAFGLVAAAFLAYYAAGSYASNGAMMLDPLRAPRDYLSRAPGRALLLLTSWIIQINPFLFYFHQQAAAAKFWMLAAGLPWLLGVGWAVLRRHGRDRTVLAMGVWSLVFLPILVCTPADDRVMTIPSVGLAYVAAAWLTQRADGRLGRLAAWLFLIAPVIYAEGAIAIVGLLEWKANHQLDVAVASFGRPPRNGDAVFFLNAPQPIDVLWTQERCEARAGLQQPRVAVLSDVIAPTVERIGPAALRLTANGREPFLSSFIGRMGRVRGTRIEPGHRVELDEYSVTASRVEDGGMMELTIEFKHPLDWDGYRFFLLSMFSPPERVTFTTTHPAR